MSVTSVVKHPETRTMTLTAEFSATPEQVWQLWADPRLLERWWGPPTYPATVDDHDLTPGGSVTYVMTGPEGDRHRGWWHVLAVDPPRGLELDDGFADDAGRPVPDMPVTRMRLRVEPVGQGSTRMSVTSTFASVEAMEQLVAMGMEEGMSLAVGQMDDILASLPVT